MKCLHCGCETETPLCQDCRSEEILELVYREVMYVAPEECTLPQVAELKHRQVEPKGERSILPQVFALFGPTVTEYYLCQYYKAMKDPRYEALAVAYLNSRDWLEERTQRILYNHIDYYLPNDFSSPLAWCKKIEARDDLACDLYTAAAHYRGMIGDYDLADALIRRARTYDKKDRGWLYRQEEAVPEHLAKAKQEIDRWRQKPYWPATEARRRALLPFYEERGIHVNRRIDNRPKKVEENDFKPISEHRGLTPDGYCAFWCAAGFSIVSAKSIYQIAAVKVKGGKIVDRFQSYIRPWDSASARNAAAKEGTVPVEVLESAEDVDLVMKHFFAFVGDCVLVSTDALGEQAKLISRAARYTGMAEIKNRFLDLLDLAEDILPDLDPAKNSRESLLGRFGLSEGKDALAKAEANHKLYQKLKAMGN